MLQEADRFYSNAEIAGLFNVDAGYIRKIKGQQEEALRGLWKVENNTTVWSQQGLEKLATFVKTAEAQKFLGQITVAKVEQRQIERSQPQPHLQTTPTTSTTATNTIATRYSSAPQMIGEGIATQMINNGAIAEIDRAVFETLLAGLETVPLTFDVSFDEEFNLVVGECNHCGAIVGGVE